MKIRTGFVGGLILIFALVMLVEGEEAQQQPDQVKTKVLDAVKRDLKKKTRNSGTLDIYDKDKDAVRNLRADKTHEEVAEQDGKYLTTADYRDIKTGDVAQVEIEVVQEGEEYLVKDIRIKGVQALKQDEASEAKQYSDDEVQAFMRDYLKKQTEFTDGLVMLFDKDNDKMRKLKLTELKKEVRRMGIFYISRAQFEDADTDETLSIDISVENIKGKLNTQALRIRDIRKVPRP
jgi:hypothetical protein